MEFRRPRPVGLKGHAVCDEKWMWHAQVAEDPGAPASKDTLGRLSDAVGDVSEYLSDDDKS